MTADTFGTLAEAGISVLAGGYVTLLGHRVIGKKPGENLKYDEWHARWGGWFRMLGPLIAIIGVVLAVGRLLMKQSGQ